MSLAFLHSGPWRRLIDTNCAPACFAMRVHAGSGAKPRAMARGRQFSPARHWKAGRAGRRRSRNVVCCGIMNGRLGRLGRQPAGEEEEEEVGNVNAITPSKLSSAPFTTISTPPYSSPSDRLDSCRNPRYILRLTPLLAPPGIYLEAPKHQCTLKHLRPRQNRFTRSSYPINPISDGRLVIHSCRLY